MKGNGESKTGLGSGRGVMVPMGPSSTTDGSQYLGRPRRYRYAGSSGQPSMSADSGFSSVDGLARVNKGHEDDIFSEPMFPEQVEEEMDEDDYFLQTRKLPIYSLGSRPRYGKRKLNPLKEGFLPGFVEDFAKSLGLSVPGVDVLIGKMLLDREAESGNFAIEEMCRLIGIESGTVSTAMIDDDDGPMIEVIQYICNLDPKDRLEARTQFREFLESLKDAIVTLVQAYDSVFTLLAGQLGPQAATPEEVVTVPAVNFISGISGFFVRAMPIERLVFNLSSKLAQMFTGVMEISSHIESVSPRYGEAMGKLESGFGPVFSAIRQRPALSLSRLGSLYAALDGDTSLCVVSSLPISDEAALEVEEDDSELPPESAGVSALPGAGVETLSDYEPEHTHGEHDLEIISGETDSDVEDDYFPEAQHCACPISEARFRLLENRYNRIARNLEMSESTLREFVREMIWEAKKDEKDSQDMPSRHGATGYLPSSVLPYGQDYITDEEQEEREDIADEYAVSYKGDLGYGAHSARPRRETLSEIALRRIIREEAKKLLSNDKDPKKKDEEDKDEASVVSGGGGGPVTPLGTGPDGGKGHDHEARERSIYANERGFGGGKRSSTWMTYPVKGY